MSIPHPAAGKLEPGLRFQLVRQPDVIRNSNSAKFEALACAHRDER
jgi:hypothetical protein